jgi:cytochrome P450
MPLAVAPGRLPVLGHLVAMGRDPMAFLQDLRMRGDVVTFYLGPRAVHQINSPELIRRVLVTDAHKFERGEVFRKARLLLGNGLATADEPVHMRQRRVMQPAFHQDRITAYVTVMREQIQEVVASWSPDRPIRLDREMAELTLAVTAKALFRADLGRAAVDEVRRSIGPILNGVVKRAMIPVDFVERIPTPGNRRFDAALHRLVTNVDQVIDAYRAAGVDHGDLLSMLVAAEGMDDDEVRTQVLNILMAGTDTTAITLSWAFCELARNPEVERRVHEEIDTVLGGRPVTMADLGDLPYLDRVLSEVVRLHTPVWLLMRKATEPVELGDVTIDAGAEVMVSMPALHRDPTLFPDPTRFDPDRWLAADAKEWGRSRFIPFGAGGHKCIGDGFAWAEMTTAVATICARWRLRSVPGHEVKEVARAFLRPNALPMTVEAR